MLTEVQEFIQCLSQYDYSVAEKVASRFMKSTFGSRNDAPSRTNDLENEFRNKLSLATFQQQLYPRLQNLLHLEKLYTSLSLSRPRRMFGRESLDEAYRIFQSECSREVSHLESIKDSTFHSNEIEIDPNGSSTLFEMVVLLCKQLGHFAETRAKQIQLWHALSQCNSSSDMVKLIPTAEKNFKSTDCILLASLSPSLACMIDRENHIFTLLLRSELGIQKHDMMSSLSHVFNAQMVLSEWKAHAFPIDRPKPFLLTSLTYPEHMQFWFQFLHHHMCKLSLHFNKLVFHQQKLGMDYIDSISDFIRSQKFEASFHLIYILQPNQMEFFDPSGYAFPSSEESVQNSSGILNYQPIYSNPKELTSSELANAVSILMTHTKQGRTLEPGELIPFVDEKLNKSYYLTKLEGYLLALILFNEKKTREVNTIEFLTSLKNNLSAKALLKMIH
ncbi:hypothetical protein HMI54_003742 [Coelomomyces lativittatus]|nr:hypothetical protein HMI54_003742 [Coelomomyces lativittatus]KAJ1515486.1 hypothetical protein HMI56_004309 [Coelomomyces lativittatus]KAJ1518116.1 hypothetical protein HMI55_002852 [Coelomomyces lativittatus]